MQQQQNDPMSWGQKFNIVYWLCLVHQRAIVVPLRSGFGTEALGAPCLLAVLLLYLWGQFSQDMLVWAYGGLFILYQGYRRFQSLRLARGGARVHSLYDGRCGGVLGRMNERTAKLVFEPALVFGCGVALYWLYQENGLPVAGLPYLFLAGGFTLPFVEAVKQTAWDRRVQGISDSRIEQEQMMGDYKNRYGDS